MEDYVVTEHSAHRLARAAGKGLGGGAGKAGRCSGLQLFQTGQVEGRVARPSSGPEDPALATVAGGGGDAER